jgi:hypothetical protein
MNAWLDNMEACSIDLIFLSFFLRWYQNGLLERPLGVGVVLFFLSCPFPSEQREAMLLVSGFIQYLLFCCFLTYRLGVIPLFFWEEFQFSSSGELSYVWLASGAVGW